MTELRIATYNLQSGIGMDRRFVPGRIAAVIDELCADVIALQEFLSPVETFDLKAHLAASTRFHAVLMPTMTFPHGSFGNAVLSRWPILDVAEHDLSVGAYEPRGALEVTVGEARPLLRVIATHLGLHAAERREQIARLSGIVKRGPTIPCVLAGDFNIVRSRSKDYAALDAHFGACPAPRSFPSIAPFFALDRIWASPRAALVGIETYRSWSARLASDHLPVVATLDFPD